VFENYPILKKTKNFIDDRGTMDVLLENNKFEVKIIKMTTSSRGVLRGFHYQKKPYMQNKKIYVLEGEIQDVVMKIDENNNPTKEYVVKNISSSSGICELTIPSNWAHAYLTLSVNSKVLYICDQHYGDEIVFNPIQFFDDWIIPTKGLIISNKDLK
jgi:dTDP-4-dehydrorhamnose 3,5-epimerase